MKIVITDFYCSSNRGDAAILEGMLKSLKKLFPEASITVLSYFPEITKIINKIPSDKPLIDTSNLSLRKLVIIAYLIIWAWFYKIGVKIPEFNLKNTIRYYSSCDILVSVGGTFINDNYRPAILGRLFNLYFAKLLGKPVVIYAQSIGPFNTYTYRTIAHFILNRLDLITVRDVESKKLLEKIGVNKPPIYVTADAAFSLLPHALEVGKNLLIYEGFNVQSNKLKVSISVRKWNFYEKNVNLSHENFIFSIAAAADYLIERKNAEIIFVSTCTGFGGYSNDDRIIAHEVLKKMKNKAKILCGEYSPRQLSSIYGNMDLHIGTRMHSNILAMLNATPIIAIQYEFKTGELMDFFGLNEFVLDINNINPESLIDLVEKTIINKTFIQQQIIKKLPELRLQADNNAKLVYELLTQNENTAKYDYEKAG